MKTTWVSASTTTEIIKQTIKLRDTPVIATLRAVPAAAGCSVSITTITKIAAPMEQAYISEDIIIKLADSCGMSEPNRPQRRPVR